MSAGIVGRRAAAALTVALAVAAGASCGSPTRDLLVQPFDAGVDATPPVSDGSAEVDPTIGGPCSEDSQCDDGVPCTFDRCDPAIGRCRNTPDDTQCDDGVFCNGREKCVLRRGCAPGPVVTCQDDNPCTIDRCVEATKSCERVLRDVDGDGDPDDHCATKRDCDDTDPLVGSNRAEVCGNFKDDNCDGQIDEQPCTSPANDVCATALAVGGPGTYIVDTSATKRDYGASCSVSNAAASRDVVLAITVPGVPADGPRDVEVWATASKTTEVSVALQATCGQAASEIACGYASAPEARAVARGITPGDTVYAIVAALADTPLSVKVDVRPASPRPTNESCAAPQPVALETPFTVSLVDPALDLVGGCDDAARTGELTYSFTLTEPRDVRVFASTLAGAGVPVVSLRDPAACAAELRCRKTANPPLFARSLPAGTHVLGVAGSTQIDASVLVKTYPPTPTPANQTCAAPPPAPVGTKLLVDLSSQEDAIDDGCFPGGPAAAYELVLTQPSDVLVIGRFAQNDNGAVSLDGVGCTKADVLACSKGATPQRINRRNLPAGTYRVVIADELGLTAELGVLVRPTVAPTVVVGANGCADALAIPPAGGFFTGDTSTATADFGAGCDAAGTPANGAKDQLLRLDLAATRRVVMDMSGSFHTTILDVRRGPACPGVEVAGGCYVGFGANRSFLDLELTAGTYFLQIDGYVNDAGPWDLDVRVLPP